jgi:hypothetical protein
MVHDEQLLSELRHRCAQLLKMKRPVGLADLNVGDFDITFWEEAAYVAGLAESALRGGKAIQVESLSELVDSRLRAEFAKRQADSRLGALVDYRAEVREIHNLLRLLSKRG